MQEIKFENSVLVPIDEYKELLKTKGKYEELTKWVEINARGGNNRYAYK